jgi:LytS/YehU family sensor histidine kinase
VAFADSAISNILLILACWLVSNIFQYYLPQKERRWNMLFIILGLSLLVLFGQKGLLLLAYSQDDDFTQFISRSLPIRFCFIFLLISCMTIVSVLWYTVEEEHENRQRKIDAEKLSKDAELYKLRQQLQPHFLFNSLNSISALVGSRPEEARKMIQQLSEFLRGTLRKEDQQWVTLGEELQYLQLYLDIEKVRFGYRLSTVIETEDRASELRLPSMLIQPIVENAIKFGLYDTTQEVTISIKANVKNQALEIIVQNPFDPETSTPNKGTGFGLNSIKRRLYLLFARNDLLETKSENNTFSTIVTIPQSI